MADIIAEALVAEEGADLSALAQRVAELADAHPLYAGVEPFLQHPTTQGAP